VRATLRGIYHRAIKLLWIVLRPLIRARLRWSGVKIALTCSRKDGGGAQIHGRISILAFAREFGFHYVETPIRELNVDGSKSDVEKWNQVILFDRLGTAKREDFKIINIFTLPALIVEVLLNAGKLNMVCFEVGHCHGYTDRFLDSIDNLRRELRENIGPTLMLKNFSYFDSVIHVRGRFGGVEESSPRLTNIQTIQEKVRFASHLSKNGDVVIFTPGIDPQIESLKSETVKVDFSSDVFHTLNTMVNASHFFMAKSSLSYVAGLLCQGAVYYEPFWHPKIKNWETLKS
jgi:hypothetical protein